MSALCTWDECAWDECMHPWDQPMRRGLEISVDMPHQRPCIGYASSEPLRPTRV